MANYSNLKTAIENAVDWNNGDNEITGQNLLDILETIIDSLGAKYKFADVATPSSSITTPDEPLFYLAGEGTYTNFSGLSVTIPRGTLAIFYYDTAWHYTTVRTDSDAFFNVNQYLGTPSTTYTKVNARNAVPAALRSKGMIITYLTTNGWIIEQNLSTSGTWGDDASWQTIGPVSVSQNSETGHTEINIGSDSHPVASVGDVNKVLANIDSIDLKSDNHLAYFNNPLILGRTYTIQNIGDAQCSIVLADSEQTTIVYLSQGLQPGQSIIVTPETEGALIGGYSTSKWAISITIITDEKPVSQSNNLVKSGGVYDFVQKSNIETKPTVFTFNKVGFFCFDVSVKSGNRYIIKNNTNVTQSIATSSDGTEEGIIDNFGSISANGSIIITPTSDANYLVGYNVSAIGSITIDALDESLSNSIDNALNEKQNFEPIKSDIAYINGKVLTDDTPPVPYSHNDYKMSLPFFLKKGQRIYLKYGSNASPYMTAIAKTDKIGSSYTAIIKGSDTSAFTTIGGCLTCNYTADEDGYYCISGLISNFGAYVITNINYVIAEQYKNISSYTVNRDYSIPYHIHKGKKYRVKNNGNASASCYTSMKPSLTDLLDKVASEPTTDTSVSNYLEAGGQCIFVASTDAEYFVGYSGSSISIEIEDIDTIDAIDKNLVDNIHGCNQNIIFQSREGRVSSIQYPPNTKWGIKAAAQNQYDRIRFTVRKSTDGVFFLCHDNTINNVARNPDGTVISEQVSANGKTIAELNAYDWGILYGTKYAGMGVPLLEDALYYASLYNLGVSMEFNYTPSESDYEDLFNMAAKYGLLENLILVPYLPEMFSYFKERNKKVSYWWGGTYVEFQSIKDSLKQFLTGENRVYIYNTPYTEFPSEEYHNAILANGFTPHYSYVFNHTQFINAVEHSMLLIDIANISSVKSTLRKYVDSLID